MNRRQTLASILTLAALILTTTEGHALECLYELGDKEAKEAGMKFRVVKAGGPDAVFVEVTFEAKEKLENTKGVVLSIYDGEKLLVTNTLTNESDKADHFKVNFCINRDLLKKTTLELKQLVGANRVCGRIKLSDMQEVKDLK